MPTFRAGVENADVYAAIQFVNNRILASSGLERERLQGELAVMRAEDPEWVTSWWDDGVLHMVPGPKLLELCVPMASLPVLAPRGADR